MPELPEVETISRQLNEVLKGRKLSRVEIVNKASFVGDPKSILGQKISGVGRKAKILEIMFENQQIVIVHLKMTGQLIYVERSQISDGRSQEKRIAGGHPSADWVNKLPSKHTRVIWDFADGSKLFFNDMRIFGWMKLMPYEKYQKEIRKKVPDVVDTDFTLDYFSGLLAKSKKAIKLVILDQDKIGGVGNIYANDALFLAGIMPDRSASSLDKEETIKLYKAVREVINMGIKYGGASAANYVDTRGLGGTYQDHFLVYKRDGEKCKNCGGKIEKTKIGGRGTFYCPGCQQ